MSWFTVQISLIWRRIKRVIYPPGTTPLRWRVHGIIFLALMSSAMTITMLFPFLPNMVKRFGYSDEETGYYAGIIASSMFFGRFLGSYWWGWTSDRFGRKPVLLVSLICLAVTTLAFGFTLSLRWAIVTRFLVGFSNGVVGNAKAILTETSDNTNQALGMAVLSVAWSGGMVIGPGIGGYLAEPVTQFPSHFAKGSFLDKFAYLLPCLVNTAIILFSIVILHCFLPRRFRNRSVVSLDDLSLSQTLSVDGSTQPASKFETPNAGSESGFCNEVSTTSENIETETFQYSSKDSLLETSHVEHGKLNSSNGVLRCERQTDASEVFNSDLSQLDNNLEHIDANEQLEPSDSDYAQLLERYDSSIEGEVVTREERDSCCWRWHLMCQDFTVWKLLRNSDVRITVANYCVFSFVVIGFDELYNIWAATSPRLGGLGFTLDKIGTSLLIAGVLMMFPQIFLFQRFEKRFGVVKTFQGCSILFMFLVVVISCLVPFYERPAVLLPILIGMLFIIKVAVGCCFCSTSISINNSVSYDQLGSLNGLAMTLTSLLRATSPMACGSIFAWSITTGVKIGFPFDEHLAFLSLGLILFFVLVLSTRIPDRVNRQWET